MDPQPDQPGYSAYSFRGLSSLQTLYLNNNQLTAVPFEALNVIGKFVLLQLIDLSLRGETVRVTCLVTVSCSLNISVVYFCN